MITMACLILKKKIVLVTVLLPRHSKEFVHIMPYEEKLFAVIFNTDSRVKLFEIYIHKFLTYTLRFLLNYIYYGNIYSSFTEPCKRLSLQYCVKG